MFTSNIDLRKLFKLILPVLLVVSCSNKNIEKANEATNATFFVDKIEGSSVINKVDPTYAIPQSRLYNFKACIKDILQSKPIQGQSFIIKESEAIANIKSDEQGCLNWSESINFNFLAQSNYVQLERVIVSNGIHKGIYPISVVINPWSHGENTSSVIDPTKETVNGLQNTNMSKSALKSEGIRSPLWATDAKVLISQKELNADGAVMELRFQSKISLNLKSTAFQKVQYPINVGKFNVELILYNQIFENGKQNLIPLATGIKIDASFNQDFLIADLPFNLKQLPNRGQIYLAVKIISPNNDSGLEPFEGVFIVSDDYTVKTEKFLTVVNNSTFNEVKNSINALPLNSASLSVTAKPGIEVEKLDIKFYKIGSESTTLRQVYFTIRACLKNNLDNKIIRNETFIVKTISKLEAINLISNQDGCISWDDSLQHKFFDTEHFITKKIMISNSNFNLEQSINVQINPWDSGANFGRDERFVEDLGSFTVNPSKESAKILFDSYSFIAHNYKYEINKNLDLSLIKNGTLTLNARVANHSSLSSGRMSNDSLRDGQYLLKWSVISLDNDQKVESVISSGQKVVTSSAGDIKTDIGFKVSAFEKLLQKSRLVVALYTIKDNRKTIEIDKASGLEATPFMSPIVLNNDQDGQKMVMVDRNLGLGNGDLFEKLNSLSSEKNMTLATNLIETKATAAVLQKQNLTKINLSNDKESLILRDGLANPNKFFTKTFNAAYYRENDQNPLLNNGVLSNFVHSGKLSADLAVKFCNFWFNDYMRRLKPENKNSVFQDNIISRLTLNCLSDVKQDPARFFSINKKIMVKKVGNIKYKKGTTTGLSVGNTFSVARADSTSVSKAWSWTTSAGLSFTLFDVFKIGTTGSYGVTKTDSHAKTVNNSVQVNSSTNLMLQTSIFDIEITNYEECASIRLNPSMLKGNNNLFNNLWSSNLKDEEKARLATSGFFVCTGIINTTPITKEESYYLVSQDNSYNRGEQDSYALENNTLFMTFRGQRDFLGFINLIQGSIKDPESPTSFERTQASTRSNLNNDFVGGLPSWPGAYSDFN